MWTCDSTPDGEQKLNISYSAVWRNCPNRSEKLVYTTYAGYQELYPNVPPAGFETRMANEFQGIKIKRDKDDNALAVFPVLETKPDQNGFGWGFDWNYRGYLFPGID